MSKKTVFMILFSVIAMLMISSAFAQVVSSPKVTKTWQPSAPRWGPPYCHESWRYTGPKICTSVGNQVLTGKDCSAYATGLEIKTAYVVGYNYRCMESRPSNGTINTCANIIKDANEADVDCGGSCPIKCAVGKICSIGTDCASNFCVNKKCSATDGRVFPLTSCSAACTDLDGCSCPTGCARSGIIASTQTCGGIISNATNGTLPGGTPKLIFSKNVGATIDASNLTFYPLNKTATSVYFTTPGRFGQMWAINLPQSKNGYHYYYYLNGNGQDGGIYPSSGFALEKIFLPANYATGTPISIYFKLYGMSDSGQYVDLTSEKVEFTIVKTEPKPTCFDSIKNQDETDVDCGGTTCAKCGINKNCLTNTDCAVGYCRLGKCSYSMGLLGVSLHSKAPEIPFDNVAYRIGVKDNYVTFPEYFIWFATLGINWSKASYGIIIESQLDNYAPKNASYGGYSQDVTKSVGEIWVPTAPNPGSVMKLRAFLTDGKYPEKTLAQSDLVTVKLIGSEIPTLNVKYGDKFSLTPGGAAQVSMPGMIGSDVRIKYISPSTIQSAVVAKAELLRASVNSKPVQVSLLGGTGYLNTIAWPDGTATVIRVTAQSASNKVIDFEVYQSTPIPVVETKKQFNDTDAGCCCASSGATLKPNVVTFGECNQPGFSFRTITASPPFDLATICTNECKRTTSGSSSPTGAAVGVYADNSVHARPRMFWQEYYAPTRGSATGAVVYVNDVTGEAFYANEVAADLHARPRMYWQEYYRPVKTGSIGTPLQPFATQRAPEYYWG